MTTYYDSIFTALNNLITINADDINSTNLNVSNETTMNNAAVKNLTIIDSLFFPLNYMWSNLINQNPLLTGTNHLVSTILIIILLNLMVLVNYLIQISVLFHNQKNQ